MIDFVSRSPHKAASLGFLKVHISYLSDLQHSDHKGKVEIHTPKIFNSKPTREGFITAVIDAEESYIKFRTGLKGKRTARIWDEAIYRSPDNTDLDEGERAMVELTMLSIKPGTPTFLQWHYTTGRKSWDLHVLTPAKSSDWPPRVHLSAEFGGGKKHIYATLERLDQDLVDSLNEHRPPHKRIVSAREKRKEKAKKAIGKRPKLAQKIAEKAPKGVTADDLLGVITALGHTITKVSERFISVLFKGRKQPRRYAIDTLLHDVETIQKGIDTPKHHGPGNL